jgi:hypothetical protein
VAGEVSVREVVLRAWLVGIGLRKVGEARGHRKTARRYVAAAEPAGLTRDAGVEAVTDELAVAEAVRPAGPNGHGVSWKVLLAHEESE